MIVKFSLFFSLDIFKPLWQSLTHAPKMGREDRSTWKSNYFMRLLVSGGSVWFVIRDGQYDTTIVDAIDTDAD